MSFRNLHSLVLCSAQIFSEIIKTIGNSRSILMSPANIVKSHSQNDDETQSLHFSEKESHGIEI